MPDDTASGCNGNANHEDSVRSPLAESMAKAVETARMQKAAYAAIWSWCLCYFQLIESVNPERDADYASARWAPARFARATPEQWLQLRRSMVDDLVKRGLSEDSILKTRSHGNDRECPRRAVESTGRNRGSKVSRPQSGERLCTDITDEKRSRVKVEQGSNQGGNSGSIQHGYGSRSGHETKGHGNILPQFGGHFRESSRDKRRSRIKIR